MQLKDLDVIVTAPPAPGWGGRYWIFPKLTTECGIVGYGECYASTVGPKCFTILSATQAFAFGCKHLLDV